MHEDERAFHGRTNSGCRIQNAEGQCTCPSLDLISLLCHRPFVCFSHLSAANGALIIPKKIRIVDSSSSSCTYNMIPTLSIVLRCPDADSRSIGREMSRRVFVRKFVDVLGDDSAEPSR